jgi:dolichol-phosphate mannosyltransferase
MKISFVVPAHDEAGALPQLLDELALALDAIGGEGEIVVVDDASTDATPDLLAARARKEPWLRPFRMRRRSGQSAALAAGFGYARGDVIVTLDADLQNDPRDAAALVAALESAPADLVCGVRVGRRDTAWRRLSSRIANGVRRALLHDDATDTGCGLKAFRTAVAWRMVRFDGWHRFFPALARREGLRVIELPVSHRPRVHGTTHYGTLDRLARSLYDLFGVMWLVRRRMPPPAEAEPIVRG